MTIYIPKLRELPLKQLSRLGDGARFSASEADGSVVALVYEWDDFKVIVNVLPAPELAGHLEGFVGWARSVAQAGGGILDESLIERIRLTTMVLGFAELVATLAGVLGEQAQVRRGELPFDVADVAWVGFAGAHALNYDRVRIRVHNTL